MTTEGDRPIHRAAHADSAGTAITGSNRHPRRSRSGTRHPKTWRVSRAVFLNPDLPWWQGSRGRSRGGRPKTARQPRPNLGGGAQERAIPQRATDGPSLAYLRARRQSLPPGGFVHVYFAGAALATFHKGTPALPFGQPWSADHRLLRCPARHAHAAWSPLSRPKGLFSHGQLVVLAWWADSYPN